MKREKMTKIRFKAKIYERFSLIFYFLFTIIPFKVHYLRVCHFNAPQEDKWIETVRLLSAELHVVHKIWMIIFAIFCSI